MATKRKRFRVHLLRYRALPSGRDSTRAQTITVWAKDEDAACEAARVEYGERRAKAPWLPGVQVNAVEEG